MFVTKMMMISHYFQKRETTRMEWGCISFPIVNSETMEMGLFIITVTMLTDIDDDKNYEIENFLEIFPIKEIFNCAQTKKPRIYFPRNVWKMPMDTSKQLSLASVINYIKPLLPEGIFVCKFSSPNQSLELSPKLVGTSLGLAVLLVLLGKKIDYRTALFSGTVQTIGAGDINDLPLTYVEKTCIKAKGADMINSILVTPPNPVEDPASIYSNVVYVTTLSELINVCEKISRCGNMRGSQLVKEILVHSKN